MKTDKDKLYIKWKEFISLGNRFVGSPGERNAADFIQQEISNLKLKKEVQEFGQESFQRDSKIILTILQPNKEKLPCQIMLGSKPTGENGITGKLSYIGTQGVIGLLEWEKFVIESEDRIPMGYVLARPDGKAMPQPLSNKSLFLPTFSIGETSLKMLKNLVSSGEEITCQGIFSTAVKKVICENIFAHIPGKESAPPILISAHYDAMYNTPGANDNGAGVIALLELANILSNEPPNRDVVLAFFAAEEWDAAGSKHYVQSLCLDRDNENPSMIINMDGIAQGPQLQAWVSTEELETDIRQKIFKAPGNLEEPSYRFPALPGSDHAPFMEKNIPVIMLTRGDNIHWHQPTDEPNVESVGNIVSVVELVEYLTRNIKNRLTNV